MARSIGDRYGNASTSEQQSYQVYEHDLARIAHSYLDRPTGGQLGGSTTSEIDAMIAEKQALRPLERKYAQENYADRNESEINALKSKVQLQHEWTDGMKAYADSDVYRMAQSGMYNLQATMEKCRMSGDHVGFNEAFDEMKSFCDAKRAEIAALLEFVKPLPPEVGGDIAGACTSMLKGTAYMYNVKGADGKEISTSVLRWRPNMIMGAKERSMGTYGMDEFTSNAFLDPNDEWNTPFRSLDGVNAFAMQQAVDPTNPKTAEYAATGTAARDTQIKNVASLVRDARDRFSSGAECGQFVTEFYAGSSNDQTHQTYADMKYYADGWSDYRKSGGQSNVTEWMRNMRAAENAAHPIERAAVPDGNGNKEVQGTGEPSVWVPKEQVLAASKAFRECARKDGKTVDPLDQTAIAAQRSILEIQAGLRKTMGFDMFPHELDKGVGKEAYDSVSSNIPKVGAIRAAALNMQAACSALGGSYDERTGTVSAHGYDASVRPAVSALASAYVRGMTKSTNGETPSDLESDMVRSLTYSAVRGFRGNESGTRIVVRRFLEGMKNGGKLPLAELVKDPETTDAVRTAIDDPEPEAKGLPPNHNSVGLLAAGRKRDVRETADFVKQYDIVRRLSEAGDKTFDVLGDDERKSGLQGVARNIMSRTTLAEGRRSLYQRDKYDTGYSSAGKAMLPMLNGGDVELLPHSVDRLFRSGDALTLVTGTDKTFGTTVGDTELVSRSAKAVEDLCTKILSDDTSAEQKRTLAGIAIPLIATVANRGLHLGPRTNVFTQTVAGLSVVGQPFRAIDLSDSEAAKFAEDMFTGASSLFGGTVSNVVAERTGLDYGTRYGKNDPIDLLPLLQKGLDEAAKKAAVEKVDAKDARKAASARASGIASSNKDVDYSGLRKVEREMFTRNAAGESSKARLLNFLQRQAVDTKDPVVAEQYDALCRSILAEFNGTKDPETAAAAVRNLENSMVVYVPVPKNRAGVPAGPLPGYGVNQYVNRMQQFYVDAAAGAAPIGAPEYVPVLMPKDEYDAYVKEKHGGDELKFRDANVDRSRDYITWRSTILPHELNAVSAKGQAETKAAMQSD